MLVDLDTFDGGIVCNGSRPGDLERSSVPRTKRMQDNGQPLSDSPL